MNDFSSLIDNFHKLSKSDKEEFVRIVTQHLIEKENDITDKKFEKGHYCLNCKSKNIIRKGFTPKGKQRYICKDCGKTFSITTNTVFYKSGKDASVWKKYVECMIHHFSIRKSAIICKIHRNTAFVWRMKILDTLQKMADGVILNGIVEADETFFKVSYMGNHSNSKRFIMPRKAHRCGGEVHKRGLSKEYICVATAVNRGGLSFGKIATLGKPSLKAISKTLENRIEKGSVFCTDKFSVYKTIAKQMELNHIQIDNHKKKNGIYSIQRINNYHSQLKDFISHFKGVSSKYLNNYLIWHNFINWAKESFIDKIQILFNWLIQTDMSIEYKDISNRPNLPIVC